MAARTHVILIYLFIGSFALSYTQMHISKLGAAKIFILHSENFVCEMSGCSVTLNEHEGGGCQVNIHSSAQVIVEHPSPSCSRPLVQDAVLPSLSV